MKNEERVEDEEVSVSDDLDDDDDLDGDDDDREINDDDIGEEDKPNPIDKILKPIKRRVKRKKRKVKNAFNRAFQFIILGLLLVLYLTYDYITDTLIPAFQGQEEVLITEKVIESKECFKIVIDTGESFCVGEGQFSQLFVGETHYIWEDSYGVRRLEVKKNEVKDFLR